MDPIIISTTRSIENNAADVSDVALTKEKPKMSSSSSCSCAKGHVYQLSASAIQKTQMNGTKKNYCYVVNVGRSDGNCYQISRTYGDIVGLNNSLPQVKQLIMEKKLKKENIPKLPDRVEKTKDLPKLNKYFDSLLRMQDGNNLLSKAISNFCRQEHSCDRCCFEEFDLELMTTPEKALTTKAEGLQRELKHISAPLALASGRVTQNYKSEDKRQLSLKQNTVVKILRKCPTGWWFVICSDRSGWFPASYIDLIDNLDSVETGFPQTKINYKADRDYSARNDDELSFRKNDSIDVKQKNMDGWWIAEINGREGYVPATYLRPSENLSTGSECFDLCQETATMNPISRSNKSESKSKESQQISLKSYPVPEEDNKIGLHENKRELNADLHHAGGTTTERPMGLPLTISSSNRDIPKERRLSSAEGKLNSRMELNDTTQL